MTVKIKKLTPPQITAIREQFPNCIDAGIITTTNSIVSFNDGSLRNGVKWRAENVRKMLDDAAARADEPRATLLANVERKVHTRPDLVEES